MFRRFNESFAISGGLNKLLSRLADLIQLNFLCFICCIPIVTIGASVSALCAVLDKYFKNEDYIVIQDYIYYFRINFKRTTIIWLPSMFIYAAMTINIWICSMNQFNGRLLVMGMTGCIIALTVFINQYSVILVGRIELKTMPLIKNAFMLSVIGLPFSLVLLMLNLIPFFLLWYSVLYFFRFLFVWILFGISINQIVAVYFYQLILKKLSENDVGELNK